MKNLKKRSSITHCHRDPTFTIDQGESHQYKEEKYRIRNS